MRSVTSLSRRRDLRLSDSWSANNLSKRRIWKIRTIKWILLQMDVTQGTMTASGDRTPNGQAALKVGQTIWADSWIVDFQCQQHGIIRYNCADSLDRTNAASYFGAVQVIHYQSQKITSCACFDWTITKFVSGWLRASSPPWLSCCTEYVRE